MTTSALAARHATAQLAAFDGFEFVVEGGSSHGAAVCAVMRPSEQDGGDSEAQVDRRHGNLSDGAAMWSR